MAQGSVYSFPHTTPPANSEFTAHTLASMGAFFVAELAKSFEWGASFFSAVIDLEAAVRTPLGRRLQDYH